MTVKLIYTGGAIGAVHEKSGDTSSPLVPGKLDDVLRCSYLKTDDINFEACTTFELDSAKIKNKERAAIAEAIEDNYDKYEGFVILHGTDTMAYTAAALSFMLNNLDKPVVLVGSVRPISYTRNDAVQNIENALAFAAPRKTKIPVVPEVCVFSRDELLRGNRIKYKDAFSFNAFDSPNYPALGHSLSAGLRVETNLIREKLTGPFCINTQMDDNVIMFTFFPDIKPNLLEYLLLGTDVKGVVMQTYGTGDMSTEPELIKPIKKAIDKGVVIVNVTQCFHGSVLQGKYETSKPLTEAGVTSGWDMTPEAALCKLMHLFGQGCAPDDVREVMQKDLRGEITVKSKPLNKIA
jgi:L-asparaginase